MAEGAGGERATLSDWATHLNTLFPEARLKRTLEMRGADAQSSDLTCALPALWKGLLYDERSLDKLEQMIEPLNAGMVAETRPSLVESGLQARLAGRMVQGWAEEVVDVALGGLERIGAKNAEGEDERIYLQPLEQLLDEGKTSADLMLEAARDAKDFAAAVIERTRV
jgi:glutamate--cysteine ligase